MTDTKLRMTIFSAAAMVGFVLAGSGTANAITWHTCPDGTKVTDSQAWKCKFKKKTRKGPVFSTQALGLTGTTGQQQGQAPKPKDSTKKWRDYIFEGAKPPPPRPK